MVEGIVGRSRKNWSFEGQLFVKESFVHGERDRELNSLGGE